MIKNYLKIAWRRLKSNSLFSFINIVGLALGMAVVMLIGLWIESELSFNKNFEHYDRIAQVMQTVSLDGQLVTSPQVPVPLGPELQSVYGNDFQQVIRCSGSDPHVLALGRKTFIKTGRFMDPSAPEVLSLQMLEGTRAGLQDTHSILLSRSLASVLFGGSEAMGKMVKIDDTVDVRVTGVYNDLPFNSSFSDLAFLGPWNLDTTLNGEIGATQHLWTDNPAQVLVLLKSNADIHSVSNKITRIIADKPGPAGSYKESAVLLHPMSDWHLYSEFKNGKNAGGRIEYVWLFGFIGIFILLLACINFMNLSTARSGKRGREVGVRKAIGSSRGQLMSQFFVESLSIAFIAFILSMLFVLLALPFFNRLTGKEIDFLWQDPVFWLSSIGFAIFTGFIAGSYPALYLSAFRPVTVLKSSIPGGGGGSASVLRKVLVIVQFSISAILAIATVVVYQQIQFARNRPVGYDRSGLVLTRLNNQDIYKHFMALREDLLQTGDVMEVAESTSFTTEVRNIDEGVAWEGWDSTRPAAITMEGVTIEYGKTVGWQVKAGRDYSRAFSSDAMSMVINESAAKIMNLGNPVGKTLRWSGARFTIVGVVSDMVMESPYTPTMPTVFYIAPWWMPVVNIRLKPNVGVADAMSRIEAIFNKYDPAEPFNYAFADAEYDAKFRAEQRIGSLASFFCSLAIFISCLGLFGLVTFITEQRTKEVSVRKVLGASVFSLWRLLSKEFFMLVLLSECIAMPIAYYFMYTWLQHYSYRTGIKWWIFALTALTAFLITQLTISYQVLKLARTNPTKNLRSE